MKHILFICLFFFFTISYAQTNIQKDTLAKYSYEELSKKFYAVKPDSLKAILYAKYYIKKAKREKDTLQEAEGNYYLSDITKDSIYFVNYWNKILKNKNTNKSFITIGNIEVGDFYYHKGKKDLALKRYLEAKKQSFKTDIDSLKSMSSLRVGIIKSHNKKFKDAINHYKISLSYHHLYNSKKSFHKYSSILYNLSESFKLLKQYDSAQYYNNKIIFYAKKYKDSIIIGYASFNNGNISYEKKDYLSSIKHLKKAIHYIKLDENYFILSSLYYNLGESYNMLGDNLNSLKYYLKVDSLFLKTGNYYKNQKPAYKALAEYYKKENNDVKQLEYINKYLKVDSVVNARSKSINKNLTENYDIPNLLAERKLIEDRLKSKLSNFEKWMWGTSSIALIFLVFLLLQIRKRKRYKKRFKELVHNHKEHSTTVNTVSKKENTIPKEITNQILIQLKTFEINNEYISSQITLNNLAKKLNTNSKYLSQVINQHKNQSFSNYINQLRINYTIERLKKDAKFRKYSVKAIAYEVGFNTTESFSKAFYKFTKIKPSFFIKELEKNI